MITTNFHFCKNNKYIVVDICLTTVDCIYRSFQASTDYSSLLPYTSANITTTVTTIVTESEKPTVVAIPPVNKQAKIEPNIAVGNLFELFDCSI